MRAGTRAKPSQECTSWTKVISQLSAIAGQTDKGHRGGGEPGSCDAENVKIGADVGGNGSTVVVTRTPSATGSTLASNTVVLPSVLASTALLSVRSTWCESHCKNRTYIVAHRHHRRMTNIMREHLLHANAF